MITEPTFSIEPKGVNRLSVPNMLHVMIAGNADWVVPAGHRSRRWTVIDVPDRRVGDVEYWTKLRSEMDSGGVAAMLHDLLARDLGDWHPRQIVETDALVSQRDASLKPEEQWVLSLLEAGELPGGPIANAEPTWRSVDTLRDDAHKRVPLCRQLSDRRRSAPLKLIGAMSELRGEYRARGWLFPELDSARAEWCRRFGPRTWPTVDGW